ncbi:hypothetical protein MATR_09830 [Marivirga tractuosa]|uniref:Uncharacterized protein n=1 Tax=Marivirga tractuosa (strain ATCC 23168 / DSM 4126 / NBRC 15989 / NCIMB 1408 / VKM B-1430 / H-43) TaxID=643867 RepID=E4TMV7_MARTH|nr:hypothetical protein Ftrac_1398 [Marivirga tractuosa DSM 4126]BDD14158.1 hypothetical protein MATR_09830 [Marivirga tractuosa]
MRNQNLKSQGLFKSGHALPKYAQVKEVLKFKTKSNV